MRKIQKSLLDLIDLAIKGICDGLGGEDRSK